MSRRCVLPAAWPPIRCSLTVRRRLIFLNGLVKDTRILNWSPCWTLTISCRANVPRAGLFGASRRIAKPYDASLDMQQFEGGVLPASLWESIVRKPRNTMVALKLQRGPKLVDCLSLRADRLRMIFVTERFCCYLRSTGCEAVKELGFD